MIRTVVQISLLRLWNNKAELVLTFVVPILFFSIFAWIFGSRDSGATPLLKIAICDEVNTELSRATIDSLEKMKSLRFHHAALPNQEVANPSRLDRETAESWVRRGLVSAAVVFAAPPPSETADGTYGIELMADSFDQVAGQVISALVQKASLTAQAQMAAPTNAATRLAFQESKAPAIALASVAHSAERRNPLTLQPPSIAMIDVMGKKKSNPVIAMYAAGIAVMFLLFSATTASGSLLDERENATLERLLCSQMTMDHLLMGKWCYLVSIGILQTSLMFVVGAVFFGLNLAEHLDGFAAMTIVTSCAAASFALMLATICRTRTQLGWISTILILSMSALGGSMVPRYLMSEKIQRVGQFTFNAWALDGYNKVFWRELPIVELHKELTVLLACAFVFIVIARLFAIRWDRM